MTNDEFDKACEDAERFLAMRIMDYQGVPREYRDEDMTARVLNFNVRHRHLIDTQTQAGRDHLKSQEYWDHYRAQMVSNLTIALLETDGETSRTTSVAVPVGWFDHLIHDFLSTRIGLNWHWLRSKLIPCIQYRDIVTEWTNRRLFIPHAPIKVGDNRLYMQYLDRFSVRESARR